MKTRKEICSIVQSGVPDATEQEVDRTPPPLSIELCHQGRSLPEGELLQYL